MKQTASKIELIIPLGALYLPKIVLEVKVKKKRTILTDLGITKDFNSLGNKTKFCIYSEETTTTKLIGVNSFEMIGVKSSN